MDSDIQKLAFCMKLIAALEAELLRVRTTGHGAAHELDNIAVECGLGHSPKPGEVAAHVRQLREAVRVLAEEVAAWRRETGMDMTGPDCKTPIADSNPIARAEVEKAGETNE